MRTVIELMLGGMFAAAGVGAASGQANGPASAPASAAPPQTAASRQLPLRNPAITAAEGAKEPGNQRPEERVIPQLSIPLKPRNAAVPAAASAPAVTVPSGVDDGAARCLALREADARSACAARGPASAPAKVPPSGSRK